MSTSFYTTPSHPSAKLIKYRKSKDYTVKISAPWIRWVVLIIVCWTQFGIAYCYDNPVAIQKQLQSQYNLSSVEYNLLYSAYTFPNMILPFFSGILADVFGYDIMTLILFIIILFGHMSFVLGCQLAYYPLMFIGRFVFGIGSESFYLVTTPLIYGYFKGKELSFSLGLLLSVGRMGSSLNDYCTFYIYQQFGHNIVIAVAAGLNLLIIGLVFLILLLLYRYMAKQRIKTLEEEILEARKHRKRVGVNYQTINSADNHHSLTLSSHHGPILPHSIDGHALNQYRKQSGLSASLVSITELNQPILPTKNKKRDSEKLSIMDNNNDSSDDMFKLRDIREFDFTYWLIVLNCGLIYGSIIPWMNIGSAYLQDRYTYDHKKANILLMIPYIVSAILTPFFGWITDKCGFRGYILLMSTLILIISHYLFGWYTNDNDETLFYSVIIALSGLGIAYSIFCAIIWPAFSIVVPEKLLGTAYGIPYSFYNSVLSLFYFIVGVLTTNKNGIKNTYKNVEIFLLILSITSTLCVIQLIISDKRSGSRLNKPLATEAK